MTISIITVVFNNELIGSAIQSVIDQDYKDIEYVVIDGGSTDGTLDIINNFRKDIDILVSEPDKGIYDALNKGIQLAKGQIVGIMNADDLFADNQVLSRVAAKFKNEPNVDAFYADIVFTDRQDTQKIKRYYSSEKFRPWMFRFGTAPAHPSFYSKRSLFQKHGAYSTDFDISGDFDLLLRFLLIHKVKAKYVKDVWVKMRQGGISTSGFASIKKQNNEIIQSCRNHGVATSIPLVYSKYLFKWWGFIFKKS
ncbi:glycosyltransferase [Pedobacter chinensis]|uniref:Glycosyltransferase n=1 Tax=Pedobacter chinensis TaxID=2282421 RepID=A0A369PNZ0_9SPHI|nr:glycosyltransferase family 2 protein [Pedobacter chinensis]RDC54254.1 glycosyltransferase [Pedobacter chinensis]